MFTHYVFVNSYLNPWNLFIYTDTNIFLYCCRLCSTDTLRFDGYIGVNDLEYLHPRCSSVHQWVKNYSQIFDEHFFGNDIISFIYEFP